MTDRYAMLLLAAIYLTLGFIHRADFTDLVNKTERNGQGSALAVPTTKLWSD